MGSLAEVVEDCFGVLQLYSDGSVNRANECDIDFGDNNYKNDMIVEEGWLVEWEDYMFDEEHQLKLRVYKPSYKIKTQQNLPILYYIHGGGFCLGSRTWPNSHNSCLRLSSKLQAIVIAPDYRLAPEHKLPAAIEDGLNAVKWLQLQAKLIQGEVGAGKYDSSYYNNQSGYNKMFEDGVDFEKVFIMGDSSGGNVAHHLAIRLGARSPKLAPLRVCGYVLLAPFFGGCVRTKSEAHGPPEPILTLDSLDRFWRLCLPRGEGRDHPLANPFGPSSPNLETVSVDPMLVIVGGKEIMKDRVENYAIRLKELGKDITYAKFEGQHHGFFTHNPCSHVSDQLSQLIKRFMSANKPACLESQLHVCIIE